MLTNHLRLATLCVLMTLPAAKGSAETCSFTPLPGWSLDTTRWFGPCRAGLAEGSGALRTTQNGGFQAFYGVMEAGQPKFGVLALGNGFKAGRFESGAVLPSSERQVFIDAFAVGAKAADAVSRSFAQQKNAGSAKFYAGQAEALRNQMD